MFNKSAFNKTLFNIHYGTIGGQPAVTIVSIERDTISQKSGKDSSEVVFKSNFEIEEWEARASKPSTTPGWGTGDLVGFGRDAIPSSTEINFVVDDEELLWGDLIYTVTIYIKVGGIWYG